MKFIIFCRFERQFKISNFWAKTQRVERGILIGIWTWSFYAANAANEAVGLGWRKISFEFSSSLLRIGRSFCVRGWGETSRIRALRMCKGLYVRLLISYESYRINKSQVKRYKAIPARSTCTREKSSEHIFWLVTISFYFDWKTFYWKLRTWTW